MYNLRYHITTIVAIFLALGLGVLLGAAIGGSEALRATSNSMVTSLQERFDKLSADKVTLEKDLETNKKFSADLANTWMKDRLKGKTIVVLTDNDSSSTTARASQVIETAGGTSVRVSFLKPKFGLDDKETAQKVEALLNSTDAAKLPEAVATRLAQEWTAKPVTETEEVAIVPLPSADNPETAIEDTTTTPALAIPSLVESSTQHPPFKNKELTKLLIDRGVISLSGDIESLTHVSGAINIAIDTKSNEPNEDTLRVAAGLLGEKVPVVNTQYSATDDKLLTEAQARGYSGVAALDHTVGAYSVIALLTGAQPGTYGLEGQEPYPAVTKSNLKNTGGN